MESKGTIAETGAAGGLSKAIAKESTKQPYDIHTIVTVRDGDGHVAKPLQDLLQNDTRRQIRSLDLNSLDNIRAFASELNEQASSGQLASITALCLNAGHTSSHGQSFTKDGYEKAFQVSYLNNFLLIHLPLPSVDRLRGRVIFITSFSHDPESRYFKHLPLPKELFGPAELLAQPPPDQENKHRAGFHRYAESKMCAMIFMHALQDRLDAVEKPADITVLAVDPGCVCATSIMREQHVLNKIIVEKVLGIITPLLQKLFHQGILRTKSRLADGTLIRSIELDPQPIEVEISRRVKSSGA